MPSTGCSSCGDLGSNLRGYRSCTLPQLGHVDAYIKHQDDHHQDDHHHVDAYIKHQDIHINEYTGHHFDNNNFGKWQVVLLLFDAVLGS